MNFTSKDPCKRSLARPIHGSILGPASMVLLGLIIVTWAFPALAQTQQQPAPLGVESALPDMPAPSWVEGAGEDPDQRGPGSISGTIVDRNGTAVAGARVVLAREGQTPVQEVLSGDDGRFTFANISPGPFRLTVTAEGFAAQATSGVLHPGESYTVPQIALEVATAVTEVRVEFSPIELAQEQIKDQEKQRILAIIPNFYISYIPDAAPLTSKQKFELAWKTMVDPVTFGVNGAIAGIQQSQNDFSGYGQGAQGYAKRYGALYVDFATSTLIGNAILPSLLKQDPRYFYKGSGSVRSRLYYAVANAVICKGDNGHWQANYSAILGSLAAGGISNLYYPESDRHGAALTFENTLIGIGATAGVNVLQEFVLKRLTSNVPNSPGNSSVTP